MSITELKALAEKAIPEMWAFGSFASGEIRIGPINNLKHDYFATMVAEWEVPWDKTESSKDAFNKAAYIAAANPAAILELIAQLEDAQGEIRALRATEAGLLERVKELEEGLEKIKRGIDDELDPDWPCNSYHPNFIKAEVIARALLEKKE